jgi:imidazole glycerol-phosphate synthase subunit HisH
MKRFDDRNVGIVDYHAGNIHSIANAFAHLGARTVRVRTPADMAACSHLVLPGVGAFGFCAERLQSSGLIDSVHHWAFTQRRPLLGICVGMQLLADRSDESPQAAGLGWVGGEVRRLESDRSVRVPHVGWNTIEFTDACGEFPAGSRADVYFDHSYAYGTPRTGTTLARCTHGASFSAVIARDNVLAAQFHPEKSQTAGLRFLSGFLS